MIFSKTRNLIMRYASARQAFLNFQRTVARLARIVFLTAGLFALYIFTVGLTKLLMCVFARSTLYGPWRDNGISMWKTVSGYDPCSGAFDRQS